MGKNIPAVYYSAASGKEIDGKRDERNKNNKCNTAAGKTASKNIFESTQLAALA